MISTRGRYAIRVLLDLAENDNGSYIPLKDIAERQQISKKYLEFIVKDLVSGGLLVGASGKGGGYKLLRKQIDLRPSFNTIERGRSFIALLEGYIEMQQLGLTVLHKLETIAANDKKIKDKDFPYTNIRKAYGRMLKAYQGIDEITNTEDLRRYDRQCDYVLAMQEAFITVQRGSGAHDCDVKLKRETNIENIKLVIGL